MHTSFLLQTIFSQKFFKMLYLQVLNEVDPIEIYKKKN